MITCIHRLCVFIVLSACVAARPVSARPGPPLHDAQAYSDELNRIPSPDSLRDLHTLLASEPHIVGTAGDQRMIERLAELFASFGLTVRRQPIWVYVSSPVAASIEVIPAGTQPFALSIAEPPIATDPDTADVHLTFGWNGYAGTGDVNGQVVYANYGTLEDFHRLASMGVDCHGKIVIARYGGNYRGYKARFAERAGAVGLIIYTDPADSGYVKGLAYPDGGWATPHSIQRGSLATLDYPGDPLTPFIPAEEDAPRLDPDEVSLPTIPVQPIGWGAAHEILSRMTGPPVPQGWQGGLPITYRVEGGEDLRVRLKVEQQRRIVRTENVIAELPGSVFPDEVVIAGCHHDAWNFGASDPLAGMICLVESARSFGELASQGWMPARTLRFAAWAAEEQGIIGSTEYVEQFGDELTRSAVAYINLDMAAMGPVFGAAGHPSLAPVITAAARTVPQARQPDKTIYDVWSGRFPESAPETMSLGDLGGGSDHVGFSAHLCIPSAGLHAGGSPGTSYHSNYDTLTWYRKVVGADYEPALMVTRMTNAVLARLAHEPVIPLDPSLYAEATRRHLDMIAEQIARSSAWESHRPNALQRVAAAAELFRLHAEPAMAELRATPDLDPVRIAAVNACLMQVERAWCDVGFETGRSWYRSGLSAPDQTSGYSSWMLPALRHAVSLDDPILLDERAGSYERFFMRATQLMDRIEQLLR
ncbi:MAG: transferrin receptor-like dimerization domain-containing protein [Phycisphaerales bacterium]